MLAKSFLLALLLSQALIIKLASANGDLEKVRMQLRWHHQYQFAGYYAAKHKGFYQEAGFDVELIAGGVNRHPVTEVLAGRADFAEGNGEVLLARLSGKPLVALAAILQHSPSVLLTLAKSNLENPAQLRGKKVMLMGGNSDADLIAMLHANGVNMNELDTIESTYDINDLIQGNTVAFNSYLTNEPYYLEQKGFAYNVLNPREHGVDFYSDILFTSEKNIEEDPDKVERFKQATLQGWNYAVNNSEEIIQLIFREYNNNKTLHHMRFEALTVNSLVKSELLPIGHIYENRINKMADVFVAQHMVDNKKKLTNFIYRPEKDDYSGLSQLLYLSTFAIVVCMFIITSFLKINRELKHQITQKNQAEEKLERLANSDELTNLLNRRAFIQCYQKYESMARRYGHTFTLVMLDLDFFKSINDNFGHDVGDKALMSVSEAIRNTIRDVDAAGRFGGEEFTVLLANTDISQSKVIIERLRKELECIKLEGDEGQPVKLTASFGLKQWQGESMAEMLKKVDIAMYKAKSLGRNQLCLYQHNTS